VIALRLNERPEVNAFPSPLARGVRGKVARASYLTLTFRASGEGIRNKNKRKVKRVFK
jgi:hypothetical protein